MTILLTIIASHALSRTSHLRISFIYLIFEILRIPSSPPVVTLGMGDNLTLNTSQALKARKRPRDLASVTFDEAMAIGVDGGSAPPSATGGGDSAALNTPGFSQLYMYDAAQLTDSDPLYNGELVTGRSHEHDVGHDGDVDDSDVNTDDEFESDGDIYGVNNSHRSHNHRKQPPVYSIWCARAGKYQSLNRSCRTCTPHLPERRK